MDSARLKAADSEPQNWFTGGRDQDGTYYSPLADINAGNVKNLGYAWSYDLGNPQRGQEATPIVVDGVMYTSGTWGYVYAVDAATGQERWRYDPKGDWFPARNPCCDLVNRGVAVWKGKVYVASGDGRLHAIDAATGKPVWVVDTIVDHKLPYASTGAPQIAGDVVVIGNGGSDMGHGGGARLRLGLRSVERRLPMAVLHGAAGTGPAAGNVRISRPRPRPGIRSATRSTRAAAPHGTASPTIPTLQLVYFGTANAAPYDLRLLGPGTARWTLRRLDHRTARRHRAYGVVLPDDAARSLGFRRHSENDSRRSEHRRRRPAGADAGQQERLLLCS